MGPTTVEGFSGEILERTDPGYDVERRLWNAMIDKRPALIARCRSTGDVVAALAHARKEGWRSRSAEEATASPGFRAPTAA